MIEALNKLCQLWCDRRDQKLRERNDSEIGDMVRRRRTEEVAGAFDSCYRELSAVIYSVPPPTLGEEEIGKLRMWSHRFIRILDLMLEGQRCAAKSGADAAVIGVMLCGLATRDFLDDVRPVLAKLLEQKREMIAGKAASPTTLCELRAAWEAREVSLLKELNDGHLPSQHRDEKTGERAMLRRCLEELAATHQVVLLDLLEERGHQVAERPDDDI